MAKIYRKTSPFSSFCFFVLLCSSQSYLPGSETSKFTWFISVATSSKKEWWILSRNKLDVWLVYQDYHKQHKIKEKQKNIQRFTCSAMSWQAFTQRKIKHFYSHTMNRVYALPNNNHQMNSSSLICKDIAMQIPTSNM